MLYSPSYPPSCVDQVISVVATLRPRKEVQWMVRTANLGIPPVRKLLHSSPEPCGHHPAQSVCLQCSLPRGYHYQHSCLQRPHNWMSIQGSMLETEAWRLQRSSELLSLCHGITTKSHAVVQLFTSQGTTSLSTWATIRLGRHRPRVVRNTLCFLVHLHWAVFRWQHRPVRSCRPRVRQILNTYSTNID